jgi:hypothetical protein
VKNPGNPATEHTPVDDGGIRPTLDAVRTNCLITDARHATGYTLCVYLLKMREFFRWEQQLPFSASLPQEELSDWLSAREARWEEVENQEFQAVPVNGRSFDPFDAAAINAALNPLGYVYSSGYGHGLKPVFFLGRLEQRRQSGEYTLLVSGYELARDLSAPPAMSTAGTIFIRRESLRRMLWERLEEWRWNRPDNAMKRAVECYDFEHRPEAALEAMTDTELESVLLHEIGEVQAGRLLGPDWEELLAALDHGKAEIMLRAVRDHLADALSTLPALLERINPAALHFYVANLSAMRKELAPGLMNAYERWRATGSVHELQQAAARAALHWKDLALRLLDHYRQDRQPDVARLVSMVESSSL